MRDNGRCVPEAERCLLNLERLAAEGDVELAIFSLDMHGDGFEESLDATQAERLAAVRGRLAELQATGPDDPGAGPPGMR